MRPAIVWLVLVHLHPIVDKIIQISDLHLNYSDLYGYVICICHLIDFCHDYGLRMDQDLQYTYEGQFCTQLTAPNLSFYYSKYL